MNKFTGADSKFLKLVEVFVGNPNLKLNTPLGVDDFSMGDSSLLSR